MSLFENFIIERNEKADEVAKDGSMMDGGGVEQNRTSTMQQTNRESVRNAVTHSQLSLSGGRVEK